MGLDSLLTSLNRGVAGVADVQPLRHKAFARNGTESADVAGVATAMPGADSATAATARKSGDVTRKPLQHKACTPATAATAEYVEVRREAVKVGASDTARTPADDRMEHEADKLRGNPGLTYAMTAHDDIEPEAVILTLAIRDKAACELRIPRSRYDAFALLELIEKHTARATLQ